MKRVFLVFSNFLLFDFFFFRKQRSGSLPGRPLLRYQRLQRRSTYVGRRSRSRSRSSVGDVLPFLLPLLILGGVHTHTGFSSSIRLIFFSLFLSPLYNTLSSISISLCRLFYSIPSFFSCVLWVCDTRSLRSVITFGRVVCLSVCMCEFFHHWPTNLPENVEM